jgi:hypothetical protein
MEAGSHMDKALQGEFLLQWVCLPDGRNDDPTMPGVTAHQITPASYAIRMVTISSSFNQAYEIAASRVTDQPC